MPRDIHQTPQQAELPAQPVEQEESIATDNFKHYLEVINSDSQRTRAAIYVLIAALLLIFTAYRNTTYPDWLDSRLRRLQEAAVCVEMNCSDDECEVSKKYATDFLFQGSASNNPEIGLDTTGESSRELKEQINVFIRQRTDALSLRLPFFGIAMDMNDLGMVCGLLLMAILYVLFASLKSEIDDLAVARAKALRTKPKRDNLELLIMAQVLAPPSRRGIGFGQSLYVLFLLVPVLQCFVLKSDWKTLSAAIALQGKRWAMIETRVDTGACILVVVFSVLCIWQQARLNGSLKGLSKEIEAYGKNSPDSAPGSSS